MADENKTVEIKADTGTQSIGVSSYFENKGNFDKRHFKVTTFVTIALILSVFVTGLFNKRKITGQNSKELPAPNFSHEVPITPPQILNNVTNVNVIGRRNGVSPQGKIKVLSLRGLSEIPIGSEAKAILVSGGTDGMIKAKLTQSLVVDGEPIVPENSILFGKGKSGEERLYVEFSKVIFPTGESYSILAQAFDQSDKIQGLKGSVVGSRSKKMGMAMGLGFLGGMADGLRETSGSSFFMTQKPSVKDAALGGASKAALDQSAAYLEEMKKSPNIIEVKSGSEFLIIIDEPKKKDNIYDK